MRNDPGASAPARHKPMSPQPDPPPFCFLSASSGMLPVQEVLPRVPNTPRQSGLSPILLAGVVRPSGREPSGLIWQVALVLVLLTPCR
jgi:hypothetical protein